MKTVSTKELIVVLIIVLKHATPQLSAQTFKCSSRRCRKNARIWTLNGTGFTGKLRTGFSSTTLNARGLSAGPGKRAAAVTV